MLEKAFNDKIQKVISLAEKHGYLVEPAKNGKRMLVKGSDKILIPEP